MRFGIQAYTIGNEEVVNSYSPYNYIDFISGEIGTHSRSYTLRAGERLEYMTRSKQAPTVQYLSDVSISGGTFRYTITNTNYNPMIASGTDFFIFIVR